MHASSRQRDGERTRALVLDAAERVFARNGWRHATLAAIGAEAGVSRGTPAYFFSSKSGLHTAMGTRLVEAARSAAGADATGEPRELLVSLLTGQLRVVAARPALARLAAEHWGERGGERAGGTGLAALERDLIRRVTELIDAVPGRAAGPDPGGAAALLLVSAWSGGLPNIAGGSAAAAPAGLADRVALISAIVDKLFSDNGMSSVAGEDVQVTSRSLSSSKQRSWRLPGVG